MIEKLKQFFNVVWSEADLHTAAAKDPKQLALLSATAMMIEVMAVDGEQQEVEQNMLRQILSDKFSIDAEKADLFVQQAQTVQQDATDFYSFTADINAYYSYQEKVDLIESLWQVAWADHVLDAIEQHVIRKLASLLHVSHKDLIATKLRVVN